MVGGGGIGILPEALGGGGAELPDVKGGGVDVICSFGIAVGKEGGSGSSIFSDSIDNGLVRYLGVSIHPAIVGDGEDGSKPIDVKGGVAASFIFGGRFGVCDGGDKDFD